MRKEILRIALATVVVVPLIMIGVVVRAYSPQVYFGFLGLTLVVIIFAGAIIGTRRNRFVKVQSQTQERQEADPLSLLEGLRVTSPAVFLGWRVSRPEVRRMFSEHVVGEGVDWFAVTGVESIFRGHSYLGITWADNASEDIVCFSLQSPEEIHETARTLALHEDVKATMEANYGRAETRPNTIPGYRWQFGNVQVTNDVFFPPWSDQAMNQVYIIKNQPKIKHA